MIVIAIIGILAAAIFPTVSGYMDRAKDTKKMTNLHDIEQAIQTYHTDHESYKISGAGSNGNGDGWANYTNGTVYAKSVLQALNELGYLPKPSETFTVSNFWLKPVTSNIAPCASNNSAHQDGIMLYFHDPSDRHTLSTYIKYPSQKNILDIQQMYDATIPCTIYGRNFAIGN
jgi:type II secretory pathway pseudopilin PulG